MPTDVSPYREVARLCLAAVVGAVECPASHADVAAGDDVVDDELLVGAFVGLRQFVGEADEVARDAVAAEAPHPGEFAFLQRGGEADGANDHRIVMSAAVAAVISETGVSVKGSEAVGKSYGGFFEAIKNCGACPAGKDV